MALNWIKEKLFGKPLDPNKSTAYYGQNAPTPKKGLLKVSALRKGDLWFDTTTGVAEGFIWDGKTWSPLDTENTPRKSTEGEK